MILHSIDMPLAKRGTSMKTLLLASTLALAVANVSPVFANAGPTTFRTGYFRQSAASQVAARAPHWEWQYGYVGRHARYAPHWVLVW
jgi:hypothetical protein